MSATRFIAACREDTSILAGLLSLLDEERDKVRKLMETTESVDELRRLQGACGQLRILAMELKKQVRMRDGAENQSRNGRD